MRIGILTSSRADFSIYLPLLKEMRSIAGFSLELIVFGSHLSEKHGYTLKQIEQEGYMPSFCISETAPESDSPQSIAKCMGKVTQFFSEFWSKEKFDLVFALGDRFEMFAACLAGLPFRLKIAHIHGGEKTIGAIDDVLRHSITHMAAIHFTAAEEYKKRVVRLIESEEKVFNVGALSMDNLSTLKLLSIEEMKSQFGIDFNQPAILVTFHPETVSFEKNENYIDTLLSAIEKLKEFQIVITMPNSDTMGNMVRSRIQQFSNENRHPYFHVVESFGTLGYYSCMKYCKLLLGNTSSGFGEASFFPKPVVNIGERQGGRILTPNIFQTIISEVEILNSVQKALNFESLHTDVSIYGKGGTAKKIVEVLIRYVNGI